MNTPLVSVIIVNWNGDKIIGNCLSSLLEQNYKNIEVIVVDNNSSDRSRDVIKSFKNVLLVESAINTGFAKGNNIGFQKTKGKYILLLNSDVMVTSGFLSTLVNKLEENNTIGVVQPKILYKENALHENNAINSIGAYFMPTGFLYYPGYGKNYNTPKYNKSEEIFTAYGACMLIRREVIDQIGLFDDDFFMYFEETDFCMRAWLAGWKVYLQNNIFVYHAGGVSARNYGTEKIYFHSFKNRINTYIKNLEFINLIKIIPVHIIICLGISFVYLLQGKFKFFLAINKAILWNILNFKKTLKKRKWVQSIRKVSDRYLLSVTGHPRMSYYLYLFKGLEYYKD